MPYLEYAGQSEYTATELIEQKAAIALESGKPETVDAKDLVKEFLRMHNGTAPAKMVEEFWNRENRKPSWKTISNKPVSYTHLDVYKRQELGY